MLRLITDTQSKSGKSVKQSCYNTKKLIGWVQSKQMVIDGASIIEMDGLKLEIDGLKLEM